MKVTAFILLLLPGVSFAECRYENPDELTAGAPVVKVAPMYPRRAASKGVEGCVILGYGLKVKPGTDEEGLIPTSITVLQTSDEFSKAFSKAAKRALEKWLFFSESHEPTQDVRYYSAIPFELVDETDEVTE